MSQLRKAKNSSKKTVPKSAAITRTKTIADIIAQKGENADNGDQESLLGSYYHYELAVNRNQEKQLMQVRTSARLSKRKERESIENRRKSLRKQNQSSKSKSKSKEKEEQKSKKKTSKNSQKKQESV